MIRRSALRALGLTPIVLVFLAVTAQALTSPVAVRTSRFNDILGSTDGTHLVYSKSRSGHPHIYDAYVKTGSAAPIKLNLTGQAYAGHISGDVIPFQSVGRGDSDVRFYHIAGGTRSSAGTKVNTASWEFGPSLSGNWLLFGRRNFRTQPETDRVILFNRSTHQLRVLAENSGGPDRDLFPGQVNGDYLTYTTCTSSTKTCRVTRYQISTEAKVAVPQTAPRINYGAGVSSAGVVYFARGAWACGIGVTLRKYDPSTDADTPLAKLGNGYEATDGFVFENGGSNEFLFSRATCSSSNGSWDIYKVVD